MKELEKLELELKKSDAALKPLNEQRKVDESILPQDPSVDFEELKKLAEIGHTKAMQISSVYDINQKEKQRQRQIEKQKRDEEKKLRDDEDKQRRMQLEEVEKRRRQQLAAKDSEIQANTAKTILQAENAHLAAERMHHQSQPTAVNSAVVHPASFQPPTTHFLSASKTAIKSIARNQANKPYATAVLSSGLSRSAAPASELEGVEGLSLQSDEEKDQGEQSLQQKKKRRTRTGSPPPGFTTIRSIPDFASRQAEQSQPGQSINVVVVPSSLESQPGQSMDTVSFLQQQQHSLQQQKQQHPWQQQPMQQQPLRQPMQQQPMQQQPLRQPMQQPMQQQPMRQPMQQQPMQQPLQQQPLQQQPLQQQPFRPPMQQRQMHQQPLQQQPFRPPMQQRQMHQPSRQREIIPCRFGDECYDDRPFHLPETSCCGLDTKTATERCRKPSIMVQTVSISSDF